MENCRKAPSVIAKLMGLDETPTRQKSVSRQQRVLSENYLQKFGSIGKRPRKDSSNSLRGSKKHANLRTCKDTVSRDFENKRLRLDGMQGMNSPIVNSSENNEENGRLLKKIVVLRPNLGNAQHGPRPSFLHDSQTVFAWEAKKQLLERRKGTKVSQRLQPDFVNSVGIKSKEAGKSEAVVKLPFFKGLKYSSSLNTKSVKTTRSNAAISIKKNVLVSNLSTHFTVSYNAESETKNVQTCNGDTEDRSNCSLKDECSSHLSDISSEQVFLLIVTSLCFWLNIYHSYMEIHCYLQDSPVRSHEDGSILSNCVLTDEEHSDGKVETYQHSPNSVLETPFREDYSSSSDCCGSTKTDLQG